MVDIDQKTYNIFFNYVFEWYPVLKEFSSPDNHLNNMKASKHYAKIFMLIL